MGPEPAIQRRHSTAFLCLSLTRLCPAWALTILFEVLLPDGNLGAGYPACEGRRYKRQWVHLKRSPLHEMKARLLPSTARALRPLQSSLGPSRTTSSLLHARFTLQSSAASLTLCQSLCSGWPYAQLLKP